MTTNPETRLRFVTMAFDQLGKPYVWGADGPDAFDCSGLICWIRKELGLGDWSKTHTSQRMWNECDPVAEVFPGDLCFYGNPPTKSKPFTDAKVSHVMIWYGDGRVIGASGGNRDTISIEVARKQNACVKFRKDVHYRPDFLGYRTAPLDPISPKGVS